MMQKFFLEFLRKFLRISNFGNLFIKFINEFKNGYQICMMQKFFLKFLRKLEFLILEIRE